MKTTYTFLAFFIINSLSFFGQLTVSPAASLNNIRWSHESQVLPNGNVLVFGGDNGFASSPWYYRSAEIYNPSSDNWTFTDSLHTTRSNMTSVLLNDGRVMAIGGYNSHTGIISNTCEWYDSNTGIWTTAPSMINARQYHRAVKLANGKILVVDGGNNSCEIFDPLQQVWVATGSTNISHGQGFSLTCLANGKVLAAGGQATGTNAELYDPATGLWTITNGSMHGNREYHGAILLNNGQVLVYGSSQTSDQLTSELFNPSTGAFTVTGAIPINKAGSPGVLLDDGTVLTYGLGDFSQPSNTKVIDTYSYSSGTWSYNTYNFLGTQSYTINRIYTGEILIAGGSATTGNGASGQCLRLTPAQGGGCTKPSQTLGLTNLTPSICNGNVASLQINSSENTVSYQATICGVKVGTSVSGTGGNIILTIPSTSLAVGNNIIEVLASYGGCNSVILTNTVTVNVTQSNTSKPVITAVGTTTICAGGSVTLQTSASANGYVWCTGVTTSTLSVTNSGYYCLLTQDNSNCLSLPSDTIYVTVLPYSATANAGADQTTCTNNSPVQLTGTPSGGIWSGPAITNAGLFTPATAGTGTFNLVYTYCSHKDSMIMTVNTQPNISGFTISVGKKSTCPGSTNSVSLSNTNSGVGYSLMLNGVTIGSTQYGTSGISWGTTYLNTTQIVKVSAYQSTGCGGVNVVKYDTITVHNLPNPNIQAIGDTVCYGDSVRVTLLNSELGVHYVASVYGGYGNPISDSVVGTGGNIIIKLFTKNSVQVQITAVNQFGCKNTLISTPTAMNKQITLNFTTSILGGFVGDTVKFTNTSTGAASYLWNIDNALSSASIPAPITFTSTGIKKVTLTGYTTIAGCKDSLSKTIQIVLHSPSNPGSVCSFDSLQESPNYPNSGNPAVYAFHVDKNGNNYVAYSRFNNTGSNYSGSYGLELRKYDKNGKLLWEKIQDAYTNSNGPQNFYSNFIADIETDPVGNVYLAGSFGGNYWKWDNMIINNIGSGTAVTTGYILKLDSNGVVTWIIKSNFGNTSYANGFTDLIYVDDNTIYASGYRPYSVTFADNNTSSFYGSDIAIIKINKDGKFLKGFTTQNQTNYNGDNSYLMGSYNPNPSSYIEGRIASISPKLLMTNDGKILVSGKSVSMVMFGTLSYTDTTSATTGFISTLDTSVGWVNVFRTYSLPWKYSAPYGYNYPIQFASVDKNNNIYLSDSYNGQNYLGHTVLFSSSAFITSNSGSFIAKYDFGGNLKWVNANSPVTPYGISSLDNGNTLLYGSFSNFLAVNSQNGLSHGVRSMGQQDGFLSSFDANGNTQWIQNVGSVVNDYPYQMIRENCTNRVYFSGSTNNLSYFDGASLNLSKYHAFVAHYSYDNSCSGYINPLPMVMINNAIICTGSSTTLNATGAGTYTWMPVIGLNSVTGASVIAHPTVTTNYSVTASDANNCPYTGIATVIVNPLPSITINNSSNILCAGSTVTLTASGATTYTWSTNASGATVTLSPMGTTIYTVTGTDANTCVNSDIITVAVNPLPLITITASSTSLCIGSTVTLTASGASTYAWSTNASGAIVTLSPMGTTNYTVTGTDANNCINSDTITVAVNPLPLITITASSTSLCIGSTVTLTASGASTYAWSTNASGAIVTLSPMGTTNYTVTGTDANNCMNTDTLSVLVIICTTGIENNSSNDEVIVYPNPSNNKITIEAKEITEIKLFDILGNEIISTKEKEIDVSDFTNGVYFIQVKTKQNTYTQKIIVQH